MFKQVLSVLRARSMHFAAVGALSLAPCTVSLAADFPKQPIEMTVLFGGSSATIAQVLADGLSKQLKVLREESRRRESRRIRPGAPQEVTVSWPT